MQSGGLVIAGDKFSTTGATVHVGSTECVVDTQTNTQIECITGDHEAGTFEVTVNIMDRGYATGKFMHTYELSLDPVSPASGKLTSHSLHTKQSNKIGRIYFFL